MPGPYVLVAHSWGGMIGQLYARTFPQDVVGLVLVDAFAPSLRDLLGARWEPYVKVLNDPPGETLSADPHYETFDVDASIDELLAAPPLRAGFPLVVLSKTEPFPQFPPGAGVTEADIDGVWAQAQQSLAQLLPGTPHEIATGSIHYSQVTEPDLVASAARLVIDRAAGP